MAISPIIFANLAGSFGRVAFAILKIIQKSKNRQTDPLPTHDGFYVLIGRQGALCGNINRTKGRAYISEHAVAVQANENSDTEWLAQKLDYMNLNKYSESSAQPGLAVNKLVKLKIMTPILEEQKKISGFLSAIDERISHSTNQIDSTRQYKQALLQQLFN